MIPAVYRNARYEYRLARLEAQVVELAQMCVMQAEALRGLGIFVARAQDVETHIPALPDIRGRAFGMGH